MKGLVLPKIVICAVGVASMGLVVGCSSGGHAKRPRISVYSTAYLTDDNRIVYATNTGTRPVPREDWSWTGDGVLGSPSIVIDLGTQTATFYKGDTEVGHAPVSTGRESHKTPPGDYKILQKNKNHVSNLYGDFVDASGDVVVANVSSVGDKRPAGTSFRGAPMPYFMRIAGGVGLHAGYLPGYPASHGCIRLPRGAAQRFFENAPAGTPVRVVD